jgi:cyclopropane fatty-acyl-phospholipid synthase-like methyltransferase
MTHSAPNAREAVQDFYREMPFNYYADPEQAAANLADNPIAAYPDLDALLEEDEVRSVLELGCGAGWAANAMALHYGKQVTAVDFTAKALARAQDVAARVGTGERVTFVESDLFQFDTARRFDLVASIGVLHHTADCRAAFDHAARFVAPGGFLFVGLYHLYGRRPFLELLRGLCEREGEAAAFRRFAAMAHAQEDETHLWSWFRDQVLHPHETQHTLEEVLGWLDDHGFELQTTSLNGYDDVADRAGLVELEKTFEALSVRRNVEEWRYFPGFFTVLAQRPE